MKELYTLGIQDNIIKEKLISQDPDYLYVVASHIKAFISPWDGSYIVENTKELVEAYDGGVRFYFEGPRGGYLKLDSFLYVLVDFNPDNDIDFYDWLETIQKNKKLYKPYKGNLIAE